MNIFEKTDFTGDKPSVVSIKKTEKVNLFTVGLSEKQGIRIEFWGDEVDSIRYFNIASQRSTEMVQENRRIGLGYRTRWRTACSRW